MSCKLNILHSTLFINMIYYFDIIHSVSCETLLGLSTSHTPYIRDCILLSCMATLHGQGCQPLLVPAEKA